MICAISGEIPEEPVVSTKSGHIFEKRLIKKWLDSNPHCPVTNEPLTLEDIIPIQVSHSIKPRPTSATSVPGLLQILQNEWDALMLETYSLKQQLVAVKQELSHTLYQHDAACRVIARLTKERDEARSFAANGRGSIRSQAAVETEAMEVEQPAAATSASLPQEVKAVVAKKAEELSAGRKNRTIPGDLATAEAIKGFKQISSNTLHSPSQPGITCLDVHPSDGTRILTGGIDGNAVVFSVETRKIVSTLTGHTGPITQVQFHPSQDAIFTTSADKTARLWLPGDKGFNSKHVIKTHTGSVVGCSIQPTGKYVATASEDSTWAFHGLDNGDTIARVDAGSPCSSIRFHPDGMIFGTGTTNSALKIWDIRTYKNVANFEGHSGKVTSLDFSENGYYLASSAQNTVKLWDLRKIKNLQTLDIQEGAISSVSFDFSGTYLAVAGPDIRVYLGKTFNHIATYSKHTKPVTGARFGSLAQSLVSVSMDRTVKVWGHK